MPDLVLYQCDNFGRVADGDALPDARDLTERLDPGGVYTDKECGQCGALAYPTDAAATYPHDAGAQLVFETLCDREVATAEEIKTRIDAYDGDLWFDFFGPMLDQIEAVLFPARLS
jgi:hypothetical protein